MRTPVPVNSLPIHVEPSGANEATDPVDAYIATLIATTPAGVRRTAVAGVSVFWTTLSAPPAPLVYDAGIVILLRGRKDGEVGGQAFVYDENNYLVLTLPMPFVCAHRASRAEPLCGLFVSATREDLAALLGQMEEFGDIAPQTGTSALAPVPMDVGLRAATHRLFAILHDACAARVIGPGLRREILFHVLTGPRGPALVAYAQASGDDGKLDGLIEAIQRDLSAPVSVEMMAGRVAMSLSSFHRAFRRRTGQSPLQYVKRLRLHAARNLILFEGARVGEAARRVGYESTSQFSREYKRYFSEPATYDRQIRKPEDLR